MRSHDHCEKRGEVKQETKPEKQWFYRNDGKLEKRKFNQTLDVYVAFPISGLVFYDTCIFTRGKSFEREKKGKKITCSVMPPKSALLARQPFRKLKLQIVILRSSDHEFIGPVRQFQRFETIVRFPGIVQIAKLEGEGS